MRVEYQISEHDSSGQSGLGYYHYPDQYPSVEAPRAHGGVERDASPTDSLAYFVGKRALDIVVVALFAPFLIIVLLALALLVTFSSGGSVFFSHRRICRDGRFFSMWKFRTMCANSAEVLDQYLADHPEARKEWASSHKLRYDPRVTKIGAFLRKYSLDELPQMWNVLVGEMSLVGPRPIVAAEAEKYGDSFGCYTRVKPGLSGLWQVSGRSHVTYEERVALDCSYVANWSMLLDIKILLRTLRCVVNSDGAF